MPRPALQDYQRKRDFRRTPEPRGAAPGKTFKGYFVVQKHAARQLHYDFRLELGGTLKSWAIPKGPSCNPRDKRLAVQVEDHPLEYAQFEGVIPKNQYGAGAVMVWDKGRWLPEDDDPHAALDKGHLRFTLKGEKLKGRWSLVRLRTKNRPDKNWLLIKRSDEYASDLDAEDLDAHSVASHRTLDQITADKDTKWDANQNKAVAIEHVKNRKTPRKGEVAPLPDFVTPQLATLVDNPPPGEQWLHELKYDGYRILARVDRRQLTLFSRNAKDWTERFPAIHDAILNLGLASAWLDGELCFVKADGSTSFQALQNALKANNDKPLVYFVFDLLYVNGKDISTLPLLKRKNILADFLGNALGPVRFADHLRGQGDAFYQQACEHKLEGIVSKRADRPHRSGRGREWLKIKCLKRQEFVIGGYTRRRGTRDGLGALLLGVYEKGQFVYTGKVGTGFNEQTLKSLFAELLKRRVDRSQYDKGPPQNIARSAIWVDPKLVAEIEFSHWTRAGYLRQPSFKGLREDKMPLDIVREQPQPIAPYATQRTPRVAGVALSNPDKKLYPKEAITKQALAVYYEYVAPWMLPYVAGRPLSLVRCPDGYDKECFFQKHDIDSFPKAMQRVTVMRKGERENYMVIDSVEGLISLVQMGVLEIHAWGARADRPEQPDQLIFDLDPQEQVPWKTVIASAHTLRTLLNELGLTCFAKTTGGKGLHVIVPVSRRHTWADVKSFTRAIADTLVQFNPRLYTARAATHARVGKIYIDYVRNSQGATAIAPYSTRARPGAPLAVPLAWEEVREDISSKAFTVENIRSRLDSLKKDPWESFLNTRQSITKSMRRTLGLDVSHPRKGKAA